MVNGFLQKANDPAPPSSASEAMRPGPQIPADRSPIAAGLRPGRRDGPFSPPARPGRDFSPSAASVVTRRLPGRLHPSKGSVGIVRVLESAAATRRVAAGLLKTLGP